MNIKCLRVRFARAIWGSFQHLEDKHWFFGVRNLGNLTRKHIKANVCKNYCTCACDILSYYFHYLNKTPKMVSFVVKQYAVREAKKNRYAVRTGEGV